MKKTFYMLIALWTLTAVSCAKKTAPSSQEAPTPHSTLAYESTQGVDFDLTKMSATMIYSTVFDMLIASEDYEGKTIKIKGLFNVYDNEENGQRYFAVVVPDATACCQQGLEFVWLGDHTYPADYPAIDSEITVTGTYTTEEEDGISYSYLKVTDLQS